MQSVAAFVCHHRRDSRSCIANMADSPRSHLLPLAKRQRLSAESFARVSHDSDRSSPDQAAQPLASVTAMAAKAQQSAGNSLPSFLSPVSPVLQPIPTLVSPVGAPF